MNLKMRGSLASHQTSFCLWQNKWIYEKFLGFDDPDYDNFTTLSRFIYTDLIRHDNCLNTNAETRYLTTFI